MSPRAQKSGAVLLFIAFLLTLHSPPSNAENLDLSGNIAFVRVLDKVSARSETVRVRKEDPVAIGTLLLTMRDCRKSPPEGLPEAAAYIDISEKRPADDHLEVSPSGTRVMTGNRLFSGWIFASSPALSMLEHPAYTLTLLDCLSE